MIYTIGTQEVLNNLIKLIAVKNDVFVPNAKSLKNAYQQWLNPDNFDWQGIQKQKLSDFFD